MILVHIMFLSNYKIQYLIATYRNQQYTVEQLVKQYIFTPWNDMKRMFNFDYI